MEGEGEKEGEREREREGDKHQKKRKTAEIERETTGAEMPVRKTKEDADLRQNDKTLAGWD